MTDTLTPIHIGDRILHLPTELAGSIALTRQRMDAAKKADEEMDEEEDMEDEDEPKVDMKTKMANLRKMKKDSLDDEFDEDEDEDEDEEDIEGHEDSLKSAIIETIARMDGMEDEYEYEDMEEDPRELALSLIQAFEAAKPYLPAGTTFQSLTMAEDDDGVFNPGDIYAVAINSQYPGLDIDLSNGDEVYGAFQMMIAARSPMQRSPMLLDSADEDSDRFDRAFSQQLGLRSDSSDYRPIGSSFTLKPFYTN